MSGISKMLLAGFSLGFITACVPSGELNRSKFPSNQLIIKYQEASYLNKMDKFPASDLSQLSAAAGVGLSHLRKMATDEHVLRLPQNVSDERIQQIIQKLSMHTDIQYVERDMLLQGQLVPNDTLYWYQWSLRNTGGSNMETAWDINQGMGITVAVLDSGYLPHGDLVANILPGYDLISDTTISQDGDGRDAQALDPGDWTPANACKPDTPARDSSWHGIHVAGIIGAVTNNNLGIAGVVSDAKILPVRVTGRCGGYMSDVAEGIIWAAGGTISGVPNNMHPAQVINASLGAPGTCTNTLQAAIDVARSLGSTVVVAAGNSTEDAANVLPASCAGVITVAATDSDGNRTWYTNFGSVVDLSAPGGDQQGPTMQGVISTSNTGTTTPVEDILGSIDGTSMSAPHVAGVVAMLYSLNADMNPTTAESIVKSTTRAFAATCDQCGTGILDATAAITATPIVKPPPVTSVTMVNGVAVTNIASLAGAQLQFTLNVPAGATDLNFSMSGGSGDANLYVQFGSQPSTTTYDCRPNLAGNIENCSFAAPQEGTYYVVLQAATDFSGVSLLGQFMESSTGVGFTQTNLAGNRRAWQHFSLAVGAGTSALDVQLSGGTGDADLYVRYGSKPGTWSYDCRPYIRNNEESCHFDAPQTGTWYISIRGYASYAGVTLTANAQ